MLSELGKGVTLSQTGAIGSRPFPTELSSEFLRAAAPYTTSHSLSDPSPIPASHITLLRLAQCSHTQRGGNVKELHL